MFTIFLSWPLAFISFLNRASRTIVSSFYRRHFRYQISGANNHEINGRIDHKPPAHVGIARLPPEIILLVLRNIPYHTRPELDLFVSAIFASCPQRPRSLDIAVVAAPLVCSAWRGPGTEALYELITIYTLAQCALLHRTFQDRPSLCTLVRCLRLPNLRESSVVTPPSVIQLSTNIVKACNLVHDIDILQKDEFPIDPSGVSYLRSLRLSNAGAEQNVFGTLLSTRFPVLQKLTLNGYHFDEEDARMDLLWPELRQLKALRLENCVLAMNERLTDILPRTTAKLRSLALFAVRRAFSGNQLPSFLADSVEELWIEDCWPLSFESHFASYTHLHSLHVDWHLFAVVAPFVPLNLLCISITVPGSVANSAPDYDRFEATLERLSVDIPTLEVVRIRGKRGLPLLNSEAELRKKLGLQDVSLVIEWVDRGKERPVTALRQKQSPPSETTWDEWLYV